MSPKNPSSASKKKINTNHWFYCTECEVYITHKSKQDHEKQCPVAEYVTDGGGSNQHLDYIRRGVLYSTLVEKRNYPVEGVDTLSMKHRDNIIYISEEALRLLKWRIGQYVLIEGSGHPGAPLVRTLWPAPDKFLTTILVSDYDYDVYWCSFTKGVNLLRIRSVSPDQMQIARYISLEYVPDNPFKHRYLEDNEQLNTCFQKDLKKIIKQQWKDLYVTKGSQINVDFFNQNITFKVVHWYRNPIQSTTGGSVVTTLPLHEQIKKLSLEETTTTTTTTLDHHQEEESINVNDVTIIGQITNNSTIEILDNNNNTDDDIGVIDIESSIIANDDSSISSFTNIGGLSQQLKEIQEALDLAMEYGGDEHYSMPKGLKTSRGLLVYGPSGCGKTMICDALRHHFTKSMNERQLTPQILELNVGNVFSKYIGETERKLTDLLSQIFNHYPQPSLIIIEEIHILCPKWENNYGQESGRRVSSALIRILDSLSNEMEGGRCFVLATTNQIDLLNVSLRRCGRFDNEIELPVPNRTARTEILHCIFNRMKYPEDYDLSANEIQQIAEVTHGFVGADLLHLVRQAHLHASKSDPSRRSIRMEHLRLALTQVHPSAMREVLIECPNVHWTEIGGQDELKLKLQQAIEWPLKHSEHFLRMGVDPPRGILLYGPPGCSKTMIAKALATESSLNFISIKGPELFSMWVGESERAVREVFRKARQVAPAIVFFDEIDAIGGERATDGRGGGGGSGGGRRGGGDSVQERVLTQLLTELDGVEKLENVTILAATNRPDLIDKALLRPGRIDRMIYVSLPDEDARKEIFRIKLKRTPLSSDVSMNWLSVNTEGYSGAEIQAVCQEAALSALRDDLNCPHVTSIDFQRALQTIRPRTSSKLLKLYEEYASSS